MENIRKGCNIFSLTPLLILFISHSIVHHQANCIDIIIGGGDFPPTSPPDYGECPDCQPPDLECPPPPPPPPEPECPPPPSPSRHPPPPPPPPPSPKPAPIRPPPPPPTPKPAPIRPPLPPPSTGLSLELQLAIKVIQRFKKTITRDPHNITQTWTGNKICKDYKGFICDINILDNRIRVALVNFNNFELKCKPLGFQNFLDSFPDIIAFHANSNFFTGEIPFTTSKFQPLLELDLSNNALKGEFPTTVLSQTNLTFLDLRFNYLTGNIHPQVFTLDLDVLFLNNNQFQGNIPSNLGKTTALYLTLANNYLQGSIPKSIGQASNTLREAALLNNSLSGCLPYEIGLLKKATLFDASKNTLTGPIPQSFACLKNMQILNLSYNQLYGSVPEGLCKFANLYELTLKFNYFTQVGPECRKLIKSKVLDVSMNCILDLPNQRSAEKCKYFFSKKLACPDPGSMNYVPCKIDSYGSPINRKLLVQPRTYEALKK